MDERYLKAFQAALDFVTDLHDAYGTKSRATPLELYNRLMTKITFKDKEAINKCLSGFDEFLRIHESSIVDDNMVLIPKTAIIRYGTSERVYIEIGKIIMQSRGETLNIIRQHLLGISAILEPSKRKVAELEEMIKNPRNAEEQFIGNIMEKTKLVGAGLGDTAQTPQQAVAGLLASLPDMMSGLKNGVESKRMDPEKLMSGLMGVMSTVMSQMSDMQRNITEDELGANSVLDRPNRAGAMANMLTNGSSRITVEPDNDHIAPGSTGGSSVSRHVSSD